MFQKYLYFQMSLMIRRIQKFLMFLKIPLFQRSQMNQKSLMNH